MIEKEERLMQIEKLRTKLSAFDEHLRGSFGHKDAETMFKIIQEVVGIYNKYFEKLPFDLQITNAISIHVLLLELIKRRVNDDKI